MIANLASQNPPPSPQDALSYIYLLLQELVPMARSADEAELLARLVQARDEAAEALKRLGA